MKDREGERGCLARARLGTSENIIPLKCQGNRLRLDRSGRLVARFRQAFIRLGENPNRSN